MSSGRTGASTRVSHTLLFLVVVCGGHSPAPGYAQDSPSYRGRSLQAVIEELRAGGLPLAYSSNLLPETLRIESQPTSTEPLAIVRELLAPHGLTLEESGGTWLIVRAAVAEPAPGQIAITLMSSDSTLLPGEAAAQLDGPTGPRVAIVNGQGALTGVTEGKHVLAVRAAGHLPHRAVFNVAAGEVSALTLVLVDARPRLEEVTVSASRYDVANDIQPSARYFSREEIESMAVLGNDTLRVTHRIPGVAATEFSARAHVRGGAADEMTVVLDGMELIEPYHLRDYQSVFSAIDQRIVSGMQIYSGGFGAAYGDALSGLTLVDLLEPTAARWHEIGISFLHTSAFSSGTFKQGNGQWLVSARRSNIDLLLKESIGEPSYRDAFVHLGMALGSRHRVSLNSMSFDDDILLTPDIDPGNSESGGGDTDSSQLWMKIDSEWNQRLSSRSILHATRFSGERQGLVDDVDEIVGFVDDRRTLSMQGVKQDWSWDKSESQLLAWGFEIQELDARYDYMSEVEQRGVLATLTPTPAWARALALAPEGKNYSAYISDRWRLTDRLIADLGLRWDKQTYLPAEDDEQFSPRASFLYRLGAQTDLRVSFGRFFQSERLLDLQVEDGVTEFSPAQSASHGILGVEHRFANGPSLRVEMFRKWTDSARSRYENLFDPLALMPELKPGRVRVAPDRADARGLEFLVNGEQPVTWWFGYSFSRVVDVIGDRRVLRGWDQRHALTGGLTWEVGEAWTLNAVATWHTGWPTTTLAVETIAGPSGAPQTIAVAGERNAERLASTRRIDFRASRAFDALPGSLQFFAEVTNVTGRKNPCCINYEFEALGGGQFLLEREDRSGLPFTANVGITWGF